ncbi:MAG TPA: histidine phosphatase family protein [Trebonia sp.]|nr:histidine phosphatase family protein [Trebonia sp.]
MRNNYSCMRHGQSKANVKNVIVSCIDNDSPDNFGLTDLGRQQALAAATGSGLPTDTVICSSDFARAEQTARIVAAALGAGAVTITKALRERCFGDWEGAAADNYAVVWAADKANPDHTDGHVESVSAVLSRATAFISTLERRYSGRDILLVSHGDTLQILQAGFLRMNPGGTGTSRISSPRKSAGSTWDYAAAPRHSFLATSGPVMRSSSGKVAAMMPRDTRIPAAVMR